MYSDKDPTELTKFNLGQLRLILDEIKSYEIQKNYIRSSTFVEIYFKNNVIKFIYQICSKSENETFYGIPFMIRKLSSQNIIKFIKNIENVYTE